MYLEIKNKNIDVILDPEPIRGLDVLNLVDRQRIEITHNAILEVLDSFNGESSYSDITRKDLESFPLMQWFNINDGVKFRQRKPLLNGTLVFDTEMIQGGKFSMHNHSDCVEQCDVIEGHLYDVLTKGSYKAGESVVFPAGQQHVPIALSYTVLRVYFY